MNSLCQLIFLLSLSFQILSFTESEVFAEQPLPDSPYLAPTLEEIEVKGNQRTHSSVILQLSSFEIGQEITQGYINGARARIDSSGLFESVEILKFPGKNPKSIRVQIFVKEKISWFIVPAFHYSKGSTSGGAAFGDQNLFGRNKKGFFFGDYGTKAQHIVIAYRDPFVADTRFVLAFDGLFRSETMNEYKNRNEIGRIKLRDMGGSIIPGYKWRDEFWAGIGFYYHRVVERLKRQTAPFVRQPDLTDGNDIGFMLRFEIDDLKSHKGLEQGSSLTGETLLSDRRFNSDFDYFKQVLRGRYSHLMMQNRLNLVTKATIQLGRNLPYYQEIMMGGDNLRGYLDREFRGDTRYSLNEDFLFPIYTLKSFILRGVVFYDTGVLYFKDNEFKRHNWRNGIGAGARVYLNWIAIPLLGADFGYGIEEKEYGVYLNLGASF